MFHVIIHAMAKVLQLVVMKHFKVLPVIDNLAPKRLVNMERKFFRDKRCKADIVVQKKKEKKRKEWNKALKGIQ